MCQHAETAMPATSLQGPGWESGEVTLIPVGKEVSLAAQESRAVLGRGHLTLHSGR